MSFQPYENPIGFGASDVIEFALAALLVFMALIHPRMEPYARKLAERTGWCMLLLGVLPVALRLALLPHHPVLWAGAVLSAAAFCSLCYWMLLAWTTPGWALVGGLLAVIQFGPLNAWMNNDSGDAVSAAAGCVVFGSLARLREGRRVRNAILVGIGLATIAIMLLHHTPRPAHADTVGTYLVRLEFRIRFYRFFLLAPLYLAVLAFFATMRKLRFAWILLTLLMFALGVNFFQDFQFHYIAAVTGLFVLMGVIGLQQLSRLAGPEAARLIVFLCAAHFMFWYGMHIFENAEFAPAMMQYETWNSINHRDTP